MGRESFMIKRRLLILADHLDRMKPEKTGRHFSLGIWYTDRDRTANCGTACCAVGEAAHIPKLKRLGLGLTPGVWGRAPQFKRWTSWDAVEKFFRISVKDAMYLFQGSNYPRNATPKDVAARIRTFVEQGIEAV